MRPYIFPKTIAKEFVLSIASLLSAFPHKVHFEFFWLGPGESLERELFLMEAETFEMQMFKIPWLWFL